MKIDYNLGIRLCVRSTDETLIMFNARNELDQSRFVDDLSESIAEMDEMETIRAHNIVDTIYLKHQERLKHHAMIHSNANNNSNNHAKVQLCANNLLLNEKLQDTHCDNSEIINQEKLLAIDFDDDNDGGGNENQAPLETRGHSLRPSKFSSMSNLSSGTSNNSDKTGHSSLSSSSAAGSLIAL